MKKVERLDVVKELVGMLNGTEFNEDGSLKMINNPVIKRIQSNARIVYMTDTGRVSSFYKLDMVDHFPIIRFEVIEHDEFYRVLYAVLHVNVNGKDCRIPIVDM